MTDAAGGVTSGSHGRRPGAAWASDLLALLLPPACVACGGHTIGGPGAELVCPGCRSRLRALPAPRCQRCGIPLGTGASGDGPCEECRGWPVALRHARSAVELRPPADRLVHALKYGGWKRTSETMSRRMAAVRLPEAASGPRSVVVPVPTTGTRRRIRGYNQAALLAAGVADRIDRPLVPALRRRSGGRTQVSLHPRERDRNVRRAFSVRSGYTARIRARPVLLVDDVLTTGATAGAASRALEAAGVEEIILLTFARALPYRAS